MNQVHRNIGSRPRRSRVLFLHGFSTSGELLRASLAQQHFTEEFPELEPICMTAPNVKDKDYLRKFKLDWLDKLDVCATWGAGMERHLLENGQHGFSYGEVAERLKLVIGQKGPDGFLEASGEMLKSLSAVRQFVAENGPFDGIAGIGEGGAMAGICAALQDRGVDLGLGSLKFLISLNAPRYAQAVEMGLLGENTIKLPAWALYSLNDPIPGKREFASTLETRVVHEWDGGYRMPDFGAKRDITDSLKGFLTAITTGKLCPKERIDSDVISRAISWRLRCCMRLISHPH